MSAEAPTNAEIMAVLVGHNDRFDAIDQQFDRVDQRFDRVDQRFELVEKRFELVDKRFDRLEGKIDQVSSDVIAIKVNQGYIEQHIDDLQKWARRHEADPNAHQRAA